MKAKSIFLYFIFIFVFSIILKAEKADDIIGQWYTENNESLVEIYKNNGKYYGKIIWLKEPNRNGKPKLDEKNPDDKLKERPILGLNILKDFVFDGSNEWNDGKIYDPKSGKTYSCYIKFEDTDKLKIRGYIGISLLGRTTYWTRKK
ncbi:MAG: DUF2147 domain-containing protein [Candidatus Kapaibacteriota bacterium]